MNLVIDIGNARIKWAAVERGEVGATRFVEHEGRLLRALREFQRNLPAKVESVTVSNVAGKSVTAELKSLFRARYDVEPVFVKTVAQAHGLRCAYEEPARLGVDRWVAMVAARSRALALRLTAPVCVIDAGTAVTFDVVNVDGQHLGGLIMPGAKLIARVLDTGTSGIGKTESWGLRPEGTRLFGKSTEAAVGNASWLAISAALDRAAGVVADKLGAQPCVFLAGGDARTLENWLESEVQLTPDLVLEGLAVIGSK